MKKDNTIPVDYDYKSQKLEDRKERIEKGGKNMNKYGEEYHLKGRPNWIVDLYFELDKFTMNLKPGVRKTYLESYIKYSYNEILFAYFVIRKGETLRVWAKVPYQNLGPIPLFVRDYSTTMHRPGVIIFFDDQREFVENKSAMLDTTFDIIKKALKGVTGRKKKKTPLEPVAGVELSRRGEEKIKEALKDIEGGKVEEVFKVPSVNLTLGEDGYITLVFKVHKSNKGMLFEILEKIIYE